MDTSGSIKSGVKNFGQDRGGFGNCTKASRLADLPHRFRRTRAWRLFTQVCIDKARQIEMGTKRLFYCSASAGSSLNIDAEHLTARRGG